MADDSAQVNSLPERLRTFADKVMHVPASDAMDEAADRIEELEAAAQRMAQMEEALREAERSLTCRNDDAHYCPNCDNTTYEARERVRAALQKDA